MKNFTRKQFLEWKEMGNQIFEISRVLAEEIDRMILDEILLTSTIISPIQKIITNVKYDPSPIQGLEKEKKSLGKSYNWGYASSREIDKGPTDGESYTGV